MLRIMAICCVLSIVLQSKCPTCDGSVHKDKCGHLPRIAAVLRRKATGEGFHRLLKTNVTVTFKDPWPSQNISFLIKEHFPSTAYVDPFQTLLLPNNRGSFELYFPTDTDTEKPAEASDPQSVYIFHNCSLPDGSTQSLMYSYEIPFHMRYQKAGSPSNGNNYVQITIAVPEIFIGYNNTDDYTKECQHLFWKDSANGKSTETHQWLKLSMNSPRSHETALTFQVPRGNLQLSNIVTTVTLVVVSCCCIFLVRAILRTDINEMNKKIK